MRIEHTGLPQEPHRW